MYMWKFLEVGFASNLKLDLDDLRLGLAWIQRDQDMALLLGRLWDLIG